MSGKTLPILSVIIILSILAVGTFGFFGGELFEHNGQNTCPVSFFSGSADCSALKNGANLAMHHISRIQNLSRSIVGANALLLTFSFLFVLISIVNPSLLRGMHMRAQKLLCRVHEAFEEYGILLREHMLRWFAIRYERNPNKLVWVYSVT